MSVKVPRSEFQTFIDTVPDTEVYELLGDGVETGVLNYNPKTSQVTYIHQDSGNTDVDSYNPTLPVDADFLTGDPVLDFIETLRISRAVLADCVTTIVNVWMFETGGPTAYPAEQQEVSVQIDTFGGPGGESNKISFTLNFRGDPIPGTFDSATSTFTAT